MRAKTRAGKPLRIRLLGELQLAHEGGRAVILPASRKTRALLGYLIATGQTYRREWLCDLFWDGPDDPRAELRWCLSKIRSLLQDSGTSLLTDRQHVGLELRNATVDLLLVRSLLGTGLSAASTDALKQAASLFAGEFLDGLDLPNCFRYQEWCIAERESVNRMRVGMLTALVEQLHDHPADALPYARALAVSDPLSEPGHAAVVRLLTRMGRNREALSHYERARRVFEAELGFPPAEELEAARRDIQSGSTQISTEPVSAAPAAAKEIALPQSTGSYFVGREAEQGLIQQIVAATAQRRASDILGVTGEAGIGKSHLLEYIAKRMMSAGGRAWIVRGFEPESARPYGIWFDLLRAISREQPCEDFPANLDLLFPETGAATRPGDRGRLFDAVVAVLRQIGSERPAAVIFDDIQWMDEASATLFHYAARRLDEASGLLMVCGARTGEIEDNAAASGVLRSLTREGRLRRIELGPLGSQETTQLVRLISSELDGERIFAESEGNPLFILELAKAHLRGDTEPGTTIKSLIAGHLAPLMEQARDVLLWAAAYGGAFTPDDLARAARLDAADLLMALGELERRALVRPVGDDSYDFAHDLVRQTTYRSVSQPRRKLLHRHIAEVLDGKSKRDTAFAADLAYHAALAEDYETAGGACGLAGERALRLFASVEAGNFAERGLRYVARLEESPAKVEIHISLLKLRILAAAGPGMRPLPPLIDTVTEAATAAEKHGLHAAAATAHYLLSVLHQEAGDTHHAKSSTLRAATMGRTADETTRAHQLANTARCLLELEADIGRSRELICEAEVIVASLRVEVCELYWARGLLHRWDGENDLAITSIARALALARKDEDRWREYKCLTWLAMVEQELGRYTEMEERCADLKTVAGRLGEDETPFVATLQALALLATGHASADGRLADALLRLRAIDDKFYLAYALNGAARLHLKAGRTERARHCAAEAFAAASAIRRQNEIIIARALLARASGEVSVPEIENGRLASSDRDFLSALARSTLLNGNREERAIPTAVPTVSRQGSKTKPQRR